MGGAARSFFLRAAKMLEVTTPKRRVSAVSQFPGAAPIEHILDAPTDAHRHGFVRQIGSSTRSMSSVAIAATSISPIIGFA